MAEKAEKNCIENTGNGIQEFKQILENALVVFNAFGDAVIGTDSSGVIVHMNDAAESLTLWDSSSAVGRQFTSVLSLCDTLTGQHVLNTGTLMSVSKNTDFASEHFTLTNRMNKKRQIFFKGTSIKDTNDTIAGYVFVFRDITEEYKIRENLLASEERFRNLAELLPVGLFESDVSLNLTFANTEALRMCQYTQDEFINGMNAMELLCSESREKAQKNRERRLRGEKLPVVEYQCLRKDGSVFPALMYINRVSEETGEFDGFRGVIIDISDRKKMEDKLRFLSMHDGLTNLYNRAFFETELHRMRFTESQPMGIAVCDIDGLKLINETLGHRAGDELLKKSADILRKSFGSENVIARIGGDEFAVLLPETSSENLENLCRKVQIEADTHNVLYPDLHVSLSVGYAVNSDSRKDPSDIFKVADHKMYRAKLHRTRHSRNDIVKSLTKTMEARNIVSKGQSERLQALADQIAEKSGLTRAQRDDLDLLCRFYDIGKIGIPEEILLKPGRLDSEEYSEVKDHCETGFRIALTTSELAHVAEYILKHHEWWNGQGYPLGLKGDEIPLESRILAILDAFDAMTHDRPYRKAMKKTVALKNIKSGAGTQFDPALVGIFLSVVADD